MHTDRLLTLSDTRRQVGVSRSRVYTLLAEGRFPRPVKMGSRCYFSEVEVQEWIATRLGERVQKEPSK
jgi:prophage regulatory protein